MIRSSAVVFAAAVALMSSSSEFGVVVSSQSIRTNSLRKQNHRSNNKNVIEIDEKKSNHNSHHQIPYEHSDLEVELHNILKEDFDHWDRMLGVGYQSYVPTSPPVTVTYPPTPAPVIPPTTVTYPPTPAPIVPPTTVTYSPTEYSPTAIPGEPTPILPATLWDIITSRTEEFTVLIAVSEAVGYDKILRNAVDKTLFAPNNQAFENVVPIDLLDKYLDFDLWTDEYISRLLFCHDIAGSIIFSFQFQNGTKVMPCVDVLDPSLLVTMPPLQLSKSTMPVPATVIEGDLLAQNGVMHVIDQVLTNSFLRLALPEAAAAFGGFGILLALVEATGLFDFVNGPGPFTIFAPQDSVFEGYGQEFIDLLFDDVNATRQILLNHVVPDLIIPSDVSDGTTFVSAAGFPLVIDNINPDAPREYTVNGVATFPALTGLLVSNAKVNTITDFLFIPTTTGAPVAPPTDEETPAPAPVVATDAPVPSDSTTWDIIKSRPMEFSTYIAAAETIGFDVVLQQSTDRTVFVPNDSAFESVTPSDLISKYLDVEIWSKEYIEVLLFCHELTDAVVLSTDLTNGTDIRPCTDLISPVVTITLPPPMMSKTTMPVPANIVEVDLVADNGVVHVIDQVITNSFLRYNVVEAAEFAGGYSILMELLELTGLLEFATGPGPFTLFAPPDSVFEAKGQEFIDALKVDIEGTRTVLLNHVVPDIIIPCCMEGTAEYESAAGFPIVLTNFNPANPSDFTVNGIETIPAATDLLTSNSKINTVSDIILPPTDVPVTAPPSGTDVPSLIDTSRSPDTEAPTPTGTFVLSPSDLLRLDTHVQCQ